jgi:hypothetical protein
MNTTRIKRTITWLALILAVGGVYAQHAPDPLVVDVTQNLGPINPYVYGANYGPPAAVSLDLLPQAEASGVTYFRIPAGRWGDVNDLTPNFVDLYYGQAQQWGMELAISARLPGSGGTPTSRPTNRSSIRTGFVDFTTNRVSSSTGEADSSDDPD